MQSSRSSKIHKIVLIVAIANFIYFGIEFFSAWHGYSVSLFADSIDFFEDAAVNLLIFFGLTWSVKSRSRLGHFLAGLLVLPAISFIWAAMSKLSSHQIPNAEILSSIGLGAFLVNATCALLLMSVRREGGSLTKAAFLSARNDLFANIAIIAAGFLTARFNSFWPDLVVGLGIAVMNADAAKEVWKAAKQEMTTKPSL